MYCVCVICPCLRYGTCTPQECGEHKKRQVNWTLRSKGLIIYKPNISPLFKHVCCKLQCILNPTVVFQLLMHMHLLMWETEWCKWQLRVQKDINYMKAVLTAGPWLPGRPGAPRSPCKPRGPGAPRGPSMPGSPRLPSGPREPGSPGLPTWQRKNFKWLLC